MPTLANTSAGLSGDTLLSAEDNQTVTGLKTFDRGGNAPFACVAGAAAVTHLDADKVDGKEASELAVLADNETVTGSWTFAEKITGSKGVQFPAVQVPSADPNCLDDYEENPSYAPTWTSGGSPAPAVGDGTIVGTYVKTGRKCTVHIKLTGGGTTVWGNAGNPWTFSLPFQAANEGVDYLGQALGVDSGSGVRTGVALVLANGSIMTIYETTAGSVEGSNWASNEPFAWGSGDVVNISITYTTAN